MNNLRVLYVLGLADAVPVDLFQTTGSAVSWQAFIFWKLNTNLASNLAGFFQEFFARDAEILAAKF